MAKFRDGVVEGSIRGFQFTKLRPQLGVLCDKTPLLFSPDIASCYASRLIQIEIPTTQRPMVDFCRNGFPIMFTPMAAYLRTNVTQ